MSDRLQAVCRQGTTSGTYSCAKVAHCLERDQIYLPHVLLTQVKANSLRLLEMIIIISSWTRLPATNKDCEVVTGYID